MNSAADAAVTQSRHQLPVCALVLPDGVSVRNFLLGGLADLLGEGGELVVLAGQDLERRSCRRLPKSEGRLERALRYALFYGQMRRVSTLAMQAMLATPISGRGTMSAVRRGLRRISGPLGWPPVARVLELAHNRLVGGRATTKQLAEVLLTSGVRVVFCAHQRPPEVLAPVLAAKRLGIPTVGFIFSWDNLSSKGRIAARFDHYFVWSQHMADELVQYYPWVDPASVHVTGTPQFDPYVDESLVVDRDEFLTSLGADPGRPVICYSGGDRGTAPEDPEHLRILLEVAATLPARPQVVLRPAPVDDPARYAEVVRDHPELIVAVPHWTGSFDSWADRMPTAEDVRALVNLTRHCDVNVNMASTMTLDFAINGKPVINIGFDVADPPPLGAPVFDVYYQFEHYRPVVELSAAWVVRSPDELREALAAYLADPTLHAEGRRRLVELEVGVPPGQATETIRRKLLEIAGA